MKFPRTARYERVMLFVNNLFIKEDIKSFPVDPFKIIENNNWGLITYSELAMEHGVTVEDIEEAFKSEDGYTIYDDDNYTIAYNDTKTVPGRVRFTLMHEIGHIYLNHLVDFEETVLRRSTLTEEKYKVLENEANSFARNAMAPVMVVKDLDIQRTNQLVRYFEMSQSAAIVRLNALLQDYKKMRAQLIRFQREYFQSFVYNTLHSKTCLNCNHYFIKDDVTFCPMCSSNRLFRGKGIFIMRYEGYEVDEIGRAYECPQCGNEELQYEGEHCKICSLIIINKCTNKEYWNNDLQWECGTTLDGNARYCHKCGSESTFFQQDLLDSWEIEKNRKEEEELLPF